MNRRALALVSVAVVLIAGVTWWLLPADDEVVPAPSGADSVAVAMAPPVRPVEPTAALMPEPIEDSPSPHAPPPGGLAEVEIDVIEGGRRQVGVTVQLEGPTGRVSRPTDVLGYARFSLAPGPWRITKPQRRLSSPPDGGSAEWSSALSTPLEVVSPATRFSLHLPEIHTVRGRVFNLKREPVVGANVYWSPPVTFHARAQTTTNSLGEFTLETTAESVEVRAESGQARSLTRTVSVSADVTLVIEPWTRLQVKVTGPEGDRARIRVMQNAEVVATGLGEEALWVPLGNLSVLARRNADGEVFTGKASVTTKEGPPNEVEVFLTPAPPVSGRLIDPLGKPIGGLTVAIREQNPVQDPKNPLIMKFGSGASTTTNHLGEFQLKPALARAPDPVYQLEVQGLWRTKKRVLVNLGDAPLEVEIVPSE